jgi:hypothetical protein
MEVVMAAPGDGSRWWSAVGSAGVGAFLALLVAMLVTNWVVIDVRTFDEENVRVRVPVPLNLLRVPLHMAPRGDLPLPASHAAERTRERLRALLRDLDEAPAGTPVPFRVDGERALASRSGDRLVLVVSGDECGETVRVSLPYDATRRVLERAAAGRLDPRAVLDLLVAGGRGELLAVDAGDARVRITSW